MLKVTLRTTEGKDLGTIQFPENASEVTYQQFIRFEVAYQEKEAWLEENKDLEPGDPRFVSGYINHIVKMVKAFLNDDRLFKVPLGNYHKALSKFLKVKSIKDIDLEQLEATLFTLYANIWRAVGTYQKAYDTKEQYSFEYKGKTYCLKRSYRDAITQQLKFESLTAAQAIEALEALRIYSFHKDNDPGSKFLFTTILHLVAILSLADDEQFPDTEKEIADWINKRVMYFEQVPMEIAMNVKDFFFRYQESLKKNPRFEWFFRPPRIRTDPNDKWVAELRKRNEEAMRRVGYRYIYQRMTKVGSFNGLAPTPAQSIRRAPIEDVLAELSIENAIV